MPQHTHRFRPLWLLLCSPADYQGWQRIVAYTECLVCKQRAWICGEQNPQALQSRMLEAGE